MYRNLENDEKFVLPKGDNDNGRFLFEVIEQINNNTYPFYENHPIKLSQYYGVLEEKIMNFHCYTYSDIIINLKNLIGIDEDVLIKSVKDEDSKTSSIVCFTDPNTLDEGIYESMFNIVLNTKQDKEIIEILNNYENDMFFIRAYEMLKDQVVVKVEFKQDYLSDTEKGIYESLDKLIYYILGDLKIKVHDTYMYFMDFLRWNLKFIAEEITDEKEIKDYLTRESFK
ncbi:hypothetical protein [Staphylococcus phage vB_StaM_SA1]|nr:hypothetical protein [Staphylococcus phage vB_StaM_SA1]